MIVYVDTEKKAARRLHQIYRDNQAAICSITGVSEEYMFWYIWRQGMKYLRHQCMGNMVQINELKHEPFYWNWWKEQWYQRDAEFLAYHYYSGDAPGKHPARKAEIMQMAYGYMHSDAMECDLLCKSYMHLMTSTQKTWRKKL